MSPAPGPWRLIALACRSVAHLLFVVMMTKITFDEWISMNFERFFVHVSLWAWGHVMLHEITKRGFR